MPNEFYVFTYGTLREPHSVTHTLCHDAQLVWQPGDWVVEGYGLYTVPHGIPAVKAEPGHRVIGDVWRVDPIDFRALLDYESYPSGYDYTVATATTMSEPTISISAVIFIHDYAHEFGPLSTTGDWYDPQPRTLHLVETGRNDA